MLCETQPWIKTWKIVLVDINVPSLLFYFVVLVADICQFSRSWSSPACSRRYCEKGWRETASCEGFTNYRLSVMEHLNYLSVSNTVFSNACLLAIYLIAIWLFICFLFTAFIICNCNLAFAFFKLPISVCNKLGSITHMVLPKCLLTFTLYSIFSKTAVCIMSV